VLPGWRVVEEGEEDSGRSASISGCTSLEFLERHRGHERKERRMKRDDDGKQRRLQQHREAAVTPPSSPRLPATLVPAAEGLRHLQVEGGAERPIIFGQAMPKVDHEWFSMPWWTPSTSLKEAFARSSEERRLALGIEKENEEEDEEEEEEQQYEEAKEQADVVVEDEKVKKVFVVKKSAATKAEMKKSTTSKVVVEKSASTKAVVRKENTPKAVVKKTAIKTVGGVMSTTTKAVMKKSTTSKVVVEKSASTKAVVKKSSATKAVSKSAFTKRGLQTCGTCGHRVAAAGLLHHLCIHHKAELEAAYSPAVLANQCGFCTFVSRCENLYQRKAVMVKHIGAVHRKVLDFAEQ